MKKSFLALAVSLMTVSFTPSFAKYDVIFPVKHVTFSKVTNTPEIPPVEPPVEPKPPENDCRFNYGGNTEWILFSKNINDNPHYGSRILWEGQIIYNTMHMNITKPRTTTVTVGGYVYTMDEYKPEKSYSSGTSGIWYYYHAVCRKPV